MKAPAGAAPSPEQARRREGFLMALLGVTILSPDALLVRLANAPPASIVIWRSGSALAAILLWMLLRHGWAETRRRFSSLSGWGLLAGLSGAMTGLTFNAAASWASAATILAVVATSPLWAAVFSRLILGERLALRSLIAIGVGLTGAAVAAVGGAGAGVRPHEAAGVAAALVCAMCIGASLTCLRKAPDAEPLSVLAVGCVLAVSAALFMGDPAGLPSERVIYALILGVALGPVTFALFAGSARRIRSAETALVLLLEAPLGALWVWAVLGEAPGWPAAMGGALVLGAVGVFASGGSSPPATPPGSLGAA